MKQTIKFVVPLAGAAVLALGSMAFAQDSANRMSNPDSTFAFKAAQGGLAEVQMGQLATQKASNSDVKAFGQQMVDDHSKANEELKEVAAKKGMTLPSSISTKDQATYEHLSKLEGAAFDRAYIADMVKDHRTDVAEFEKEGNSGSDPDIKGFASKTLPTLKHHLEMAETTNAKVKK